MNTQTRDTHALRRLFLGLGLLFGIWVVIFVVLMIVAALPQSATLLPIFQTAFWLWTLGSLFVGGPVFTYRAKKAGAFHVARSPEEEKARAEQKALRKEIAECRRFWSQSHEITYSYNASSIQQSNNRQGAIDSLRVMHGYFDYNGEYVSPSEAQLRRRLHISLV